MDTITPENNENVNEFQDFIETEEQYAETYGASDGTFSDEVIAKQRKHQVKSDVISAIISLVTTCGPTVMHMINSNKESMPYKPTKKDIAKLVIANALPVIKAVDTVALHGKIQNKFDEVSPIKFNDARNIVNMIYTYEPVHNMVRTTWDNYARSGKGEPQIALSAADKFNAALTGINLISPYIVDAFTDPDKTVSQKVGSIVPIGMIGGWVRQLARNNPSVGKWYNIAEATVRTVSDGSNRMTNAIRPQQGSSINKASTNINKVVGFASDILGINNNRNVYSYYNPQYDGLRGNVDSRWSY